MTDSQTNGCTGKNNMSPDPDGGNIIKSKMSVKKLHLKQRMAFSNVIESQPD